VRACSSAKLTEQQSPRKVKSVPNQDLGNEGVLVNLTFGIAKYIRNWCLAELSNLSVRTNIGRLGGSGQLFTLAFGRSTT
jgi:hypothetical protein